MIKQFKAGYIVDAVSNLITENFKPLNYFNENGNEEINKVKGLLKNLSSFDVEFPYKHKIDHNNIHPVLATINNIITRGLPTKAPIIVEEKFVEIGLVKKNSNEYALEYPVSLKELSFKTVFELFHVIEPSLKINDENYVGELGSKLEHKFLGNHQFIKQLFQTQRDFASINPEMIGGKTVDFSFTSPYLYWNDNKNRSEYKTRIFEIDGPHHLLDEYLHYDTNRDLASKEADAETFRFEQKDINENSIPYEKLFSEDLYKIFEKNFLRKPHEFLEAYSLIFIPFAVARIQKTLLEHLIANPDLFKKESIQIAIIERDLPCGALALKSLEEIFINLNALLEETEKLQLPKIELSIFENEKWVINQKLHCNVKPQNEIYFGSNDFDIIIDHSILKRSKIYREKKYTIREVIDIRSSHYFDNSIESNKKVYCANLLHYKELVNKKGDGSFINVVEYEKHINFFIKNIFRKSNFRPGQLPIISRSLQQKPVIGLLPTGGGKSLTYQLPVFLQPGLCLIVDPIKSLMEDQVRVLNNNWIDCCDYINSNLKREEKQSKLIDLKFGQTQFLFVSPERFVMEDFRGIINTIDNTKYKLAFSFCIIDEVHCLSEWGHDFRSTYLMLGKNAQKFIKTRKGKVTLVGLTATASYDVLADIERELNINHDDAANAVILIDNTIRKELFFDFIECNAKISDYTITDRDIKNKIGLIKRDKLNGYVQNSIQKLKTIDYEVISNSLNQHYHEFEVDKIGKSELKSAIENEIEAINAIPETLKSERTTSIIFCPSTKGILGVTGRVHNGQNPKEIFENLKINDANKSYFIGNDDAGRLSEEINNHFNDFLDGKTSYMVCTKAFGMGIDKEDVRVVYHVNYSSSPESYIQEAGRAGRDKKKSLCVNLINTEEFYFLNPNYIKHFPKEARIKLRYINEMFDGENFSRLRQSNKESLLNDLMLIVPNLTETFKIAPNEIREENTILSYSLDESIHDFFHKNSFKGIETELYQLERFFTRKEVINKTVFKQITDIFNLENDIKIQFYLTPDGPYQGNIWLRNADNIVFGKIIRANGVGNLSVDFNFGNTGGVMDVTLTNDVFDFICKKWKRNSPNTTLYEYVSKPVENIINYGLSLKDFFESKSSNLKFIVPLDLTKDSLSNKIILDFDLITTQSIHNVQIYLEALEKQSTDFTDYIQRIEETWNIEILNSGTYANNKKQYKELYYSNINRQDILRIIYRLYSIKFISDYTIDYNKGLVTISINKNDKNFYINATKNHLLKYLSKEKTQLKIEELEKICSDLNTFNTIKKSIKIILEFTYSDIVKKRKRAIDDIKEFITESIDQNKETNLRFINSKYNSHFKQLMYYYFNAKYAKSEFIEDDEPRSLIDDFKNNEFKKWKLFEKYTNILNNKASFINECKMMRGSCKRIWRSIANEETNDEYVLKLLYAYASFGLNNSYYFEEAEKYFMEGFENLYDKSNNYIDFEKKLYHFEQILSQEVKFENSKEFIKRAKHRLMLRITTKFAQKINNSLNDL
ncbi:DEAD/DEAH box helicase [Flavobacterium sp. F-65]|uniref:DNA 3'-5' helicase n=1 Tax=Flavobacterium pisciphilum TaxID=2893755 RepID=A0ABS8MTR1_9FLAO|nr:DEAD/DEAH box helicase [Flavobacterium sp. F-65]MCC9071265.1 DEAD/DEAH box helicase [Flavobacterium sp. F-65]